MSDGLTRMPGHRTAPSAEPQETTLLNEILPFLPADFDAAMPLYVAMGLLFVVVSRAARRKRRVRIRKRPVERVPSANVQMRALGANPHMRPHDGHWGDGTGQAKG